MSTKLTQKHLLKGTHEYEIVDDQVIVRVKAPFKQETMLSVTMAVLDPDPVITRSHLEFVSRVNGEPLLSLALSRPNVSEFNDFVNTLKQKAQAEYNTYSGINVASPPATPAGTTDEEPPEFEDVSTADIVKGKTISVEGVREAIGMLETYANSEEIKPMIAALEALADAPEDHSCLVEVASQFEKLGPAQGAVLTYAPYIIAMLSDDPFG